MLIISAMVTILFYSIIWLPYRAHRKERLQRDFNRKLKIFKLITVRRYYKSLKKYTYDEIQERYNVDHIYNMIGKV